MRQAIKDRAYPVNQKLLCYMTSNAGNITSFLPLNLKDGQSSA
jgi:hypothetical protein